VLYPEIKRKRRIHERKKDSKNSNNDQSSGAIAAHISTLVEDTIELLSNRYLLLSRSRS
jgi:hypothetical protein